ncbi:MAG: hypothetical protein ACYSWO_27595 [Planctomycetota bacterium]|jgi:hypothetical protein
MSLLHEPTAERIAAGKASGEHLVQLFETLAADAALNEESVADLAVYYLDPDDEFVVGQYVPELHLVVRRVEPDDVESGP